jgi:3-methyladenine DNA glycosylase AlkD
VHDPGDDTRIRLIREGLRERADPAKAPDMQRYMKSEMPFLGVQKAGRVALAREVFPRHPSLDSVLTLWREAQYREERYMALALLERHGPAPLPVYEELIVTGAWWDLVDAVATGPLGALLPDVADTLRAWSVDANMWKRRSAIIAQVKRRADTDFALLTECIEPNRSDREFFIRKAIGWGLRAYAWVNPGAVVAYCESHELSGLSRREALKNVRP